MTTPKLLFQRDLYGKGFGVAAKKEAKYGNDERDGSEDNWFTHGASKTSARCSQRNNLFEHRVIGGGALDDCRLLGGASVLLGSKL